MNVDLLSIFISLPDMRRREGKRYPLAGVLLFSVLAMLSGANSYRRIHDVMSARLALFNEAFPSVALSRAPAYTSLRTILLGIDAVALETAFRQHARALLADGQASIAVDGKVLRGSFDAFVHQKAVQVLSVIATVDQIILVHTEVSEKRTKFQMRKRSLVNLACRVACSRWMRCTAKKTFESIASSQNQLLVQVKADQKALLAQITAFTKTGAPLSIHTSKTRGRNRTETRIVCVHDPLEALSNGPWAGLIKAVVVVERLVWIRDPATSLLKKRSETAFYAASCLMEAKICATAIRNHWQIENCNHHVRNVTFEEDKSRIRTRASRIPARQTLLSTVSPI